jgi:ribosomal protein S18 acetylase RimI-like enzyme
MITLRPYASGDESLLIPFIISFWRAHHAETDAANAREDIAAWTAENHDLFVIMHSDKPVGFLHLNMRGSTVCWIEDIFVSADYRRRGIASEAIGLAENLLKERGVKGVSMDVVPDNLPALRLYHRLGYDRLSIITVRKDFDEFETARTEEIAGLPFRVRRF